MDELINMLNTRGSKNSSKVLTENIERLNSSIQSILNQQIKNELISSQIYRAMSMCLDAKGYVNASKVYFKYANEELEHINKSIDKLNTTKTTNDSNFE